MKHVKTFNEDLNHQMNTQEIPKELILKQSDKKIYTVWHFSRSGISDFHPSTPTLSKTRESVSYDEDEIAAAVEEVNKNNSRAKEGDKYFLAEKTISIKMLTEDEMNMLLSAHKYNI